MTQRLFSFSVPSGELFNLKAIENSEYVQDHSSIIWAASIVFSHYILSHKELFSSQKLLELGSGCGITGMSAHLIGAEVTLSDIGLAVGHLKANVDLNGLDVGVCELDWGNPEVSGLGAASFDVIIGSEVIYREPLLEILISTVDLLLKDGGTLYLVSARDRACYLHFFHNMTERGYEIKTTALTPAPMQETELGWSSREMTFNRSEELTVGWFCEGQVYSELNNLILVTCRKPVNVAAIASDDRL